MTPEQGARADLIRCGVLIGVDACVELLRETLPLLRDLSFRDRTKLLSLCDHMQELGN